MDKKILKLTVIEQRELFEQKGVFTKRNIPEDFLKSKKISVISGIRRSGKSTLLKQISELYAGDYYYFNFEDERLLDFTHNDFNDLLEILLSLYGEKKVLFFDEIQNIYGWEKFIRRLFESGYKIFVTGSNAKLLSSELATSLSGRHLKLELYPFSFKEVLDFYEFTIKKIYTTKEKARLAKYFDEYVKYGGFPEIVASKNENELKQLYQDILIKDLIVRFKIRESKAFRELALFLLSNSGSAISFNNLKKILNFRSVTTVKNYVEFLESAYLNFLASKFDYSLKKQIINDKKVYSIDTGIINTVSFAFSANSGRLLENAVFMELKRRGEEVYYHKGKKECDFLIKTGRKISMALQITENLNPENRDREINGLVEAAETFNIEKLFILTLDQEESVKIGDRKISIMPIWKWLLGNL